MGNRVTELLGIEKPVIEGCMIYVCDAKLAAAVSNAGGMGVLGANCNVDVPETDPTKNAENLRKEIKKLRELTDKPFAVGHSPNSAATASFGYTSFADEFARIMIEEKIPAVIMIGTGDNEDGVISDTKKFHEAGIKVIYRDLTCTVEKCKKAVEYGVDAIIVTGCDAGGHVSQNNVSLSAMLPQVTEVVTEVPIIAAGSIINEKSAKAAIAMGAEGVYVGTAFQIAEECRAHENYKKAIVEAKDEDVILCRSSVADTRMSTISNMQGRTCLAMANGGASNRDIGAHYAGTFNMSMIQGDVERGCVSVNAAVGALNEIRPAKAIVDDIAKAFA